MNAYFWPVDDKGNLLPEHGFQASYEVHQYSTWVKHSTIVSFPLPGDSSNSIVHAPALNCTSHFVPKAAQ